MEIEELLNGDYLWPHQANCINNCLEYIEAYNDSKVDIGGALNRLPTGTGKSGIIATLSRCIESLPRVLVLTPSIALREQLLEDIEYDFFRTIKLDNELFKKEVLKFYPNDILDKIPVFEKNKSVFVSTIQSLYLIYSEKPKVFKRLTNAIDLVIFDEGHREPAPEWARAVRAISKPRILFTATPYRNDRKRFNINEKYIYALTHQDAILGNYIRSTEFRELSADSRKPKMFVSNIIDFYKKELPKLKPQNVKTPRVIIHCNDFTDIIEIVNLLSDMGYKALGIHEQFKGALRKALIKDNADFRKTVPNLKLIRKRFIKKDDSKGLNEFDENLPLFWVHQYKLLEGIDEFSFCLIANFSPMSNARMLIQQVGRVIRNRNLQPNNTAIVLTQNGSPDYNFWKGYQKYESKYEDASLMEILYYQEMFDSVTSVLPEYHYEGRDFKTRFDWYKREDIDGQIIDEEFSYFKNINFKLSCHVMLNNGQFSIREIEEEIRKEWYTKEFDVRNNVAEKPFDDMFIMPYVKVYDSPSLKNLYLFNFKFGYTVCRLTESYLFFYDSNNSISEFINENYEPVNPENLKKLFPNEESTLQNITLRSTDIGNFIIRRQMITAASLNNTVTDLVDYLNFYSTAKGKSTINDLHSAQRYVGFTRSRVSDLTSAPIDYNQYYQWLGILGDTLNDDSVQGTHFFDRYAEFTITPEETSPLNILIDFDEIQGHFIHRESGQDLWLDLTCQDVEENSFILQIELTENQFKEYTVNVIFDTQKNKYYLDSSELKKDFVYYDKDGVENKNENFIRYLNREQCFRIIPEEKGVIYAHSQFYKPRLAVVSPKNEDSIELLSIFKPIKQLGDIISEKGKKCTQNTWQYNSLFRLIDDLGKSTELESYLHDLDYLICDDAGRNEFCDFVGLKNYPPRIVVIHCKAFSKERKRSASALQEIFGQAIKNLSYLVLSNTINPPNSKFWHEEWTAAGVEGSLKRLRLSNRKRTTDKSKYSKEELLNLYQELNRNTSTRKEVYVVLGKGFNLSEFKKNLFSDKPDPVNIQIAYLVQSTWSNIRKVASDFKIFCS